MTQVSRLKLMANTEKKNPVALSCLHVGVAVLDEMIAAQEKFLDAVRIESETVQ
jgi:hypothetical protein